MPKSSLSEKYQNRLADVQAGYEYALQTPCLQNCPDRDLPEYYEAYMSIKGDLCYRARGFAHAVRELIRQRIQYSQVNDDGSVQSI